MQISTFFLIDTLFRIFFLCVAEDHCLHSEAGAFADQLLFCGYICASRRTIKPGTKILCWALPEPEPNVNQRGLDQVQLSSWHPSVPLRQSSQPCQCHLWQGTGFQSGHVHHTMVRCTHGRSGLGQRNKVLKCLKYMGNTKLCFAITLSSNLSMSLPYLQGIFCGASTMQSWNTL